MRHGGDLTGARMKGLKGPLIDFSSNINPLGVPTPVLTCLAAHLREDLQVYPDPLCRRLRTALGSWTGRDPDRLFCGDGVSHLLHLLLPQLPEPVGLIQPCFVDYKRALRGKQVIELITLPQEGFRLTRKHLTQLNSCASLVMGNPNNPTGVLYSPEELENMLAPWLRTGGFFALDESFIDLTIGGRANSFASLMEKYRGWVFSSVTKSLALPGLRLGWVESDARTTKQLYDQSFDWAVSGPACRLADCLNELQPYRQATQEWLQTELAAQALRLDTLDLHHIPTATNFYLINFGSPTQAAEVQNHLERAGLLSRNCADFTGLGPQWVRFALKDSAANLCLICLIEDCYEN